MMITLAMLVGIWTTHCIQSQNLGLQKYVKETYTIEKSGDFEFKREWFHDSLCTEPKGADSESGTLELGGKVKSFFHGEVYAVDYSTQKGVDLGAILLSPETSLRIARGVSNSTLRNTMLGLFEYLKQ